VSRLLLDTQVLLWWDLNDPRLAGTARAAIEESEAVHVSAASAWEIAIKTALGKLTGARSSRTAVAEGGFDELPITFEHAQAAGRLPPHHADPFDRLIIAAAQVEELVIVTSDAQFSRYDVPTIRAGRMSGAPRN